MLFRKVKIYEMLREVFIYNLMLSMCMDYSLQMILFSALNVCQVKPISLIRYSMV